MASNSMGGTVKLTGESDYRKALRQITSNLKEVSSEMKLTNAQFKNGDGSLKSAKTSYSNMSNTIQQQKEKIKELRSALPALEKEYGANSDKVRTFKTQLNNAETQLVKMESETNKSTKELKNMQSGFEDAGSGAVKFGDLLKANVLGNVITDGLHAVANGIKKIGSGLISIGESAFNNYADYEQLAGGVETLFKDSAGTVENYANNAYRTAGLSANEYMETVTSFSASLLQSLNGDTAESAKVADMAITDMSDNANKMGTDMSMIQNAYQGFAKQNYTMLDNLKLGYGGTKSEMQRLLEDAQKISGQKYDISNLNDVYQAIHVIQGELGITNTTAIEAGTTIQGSVSAMKSAWQNMLTGMANGNADMSQLIDNFVLSIFGDGSDTNLGVLGNALPAIENIINSIVDELPVLLNKIIEYLPQVLETGSSILTNLVNGITQNMPQIMDAVMQILSALTTTIIDNLPQILQAGIIILTSLIKGIAEALPTLIPQIVDTVILIRETLLDNIDLIIDAGIQLILGLADGLIEALPRLIERAPEIIEKLCGAFIRNYPKMIRAGGELIGKLASGLVGSVFKLLEVAPQLISTIVNGLKNGFGEIRNAGKYMVEGLWDGIKGMASWVGDKVKEFAGNVVGNIKSALGIHSPSRVLRDEVGKYMAEGVGVGFSEEMKNVSVDMQNAIPTNFDIESEYSYKLKQVDTNQSKVESLINLLNNYLPRIASQKQIVLDSGAWVGATINEYDANLSELDYRRRRGN